MIAIQNIWKSFGEKQVHKGVDLTVNDNETTVILGRSGGGKSVLLKMIIGLIKPDAGSISVDGKNVTTMTFKQLQRLRFKFGFLFQGAALFDSMTVGENIELALRRHSDYKDVDIQDRVKYALSLVKLENVEHLMPSSISGGMKKRVGLARAIALTPKYMLYDEPTTGLDVETADGINLLINELKQNLGVTSLVVTHDVHSAFVVGDRFAIFENGQFIMTGTKDDIRNSPNPEVRKYIESDIQT
ncbi:MAG: ATP-binding cassette domain-containing protein [Ignavibacteriales bacterium]|nr:ATP-binding cassette domain-containing protein [Ignavibacteriales bacterium]